MSTRTAAATAALLAAFAAVVLSGCTAPTPDVSETPSAEKPAAETPAVDAEATPTPTPSPTTCPGRGEGIVTAGQPLNVGLYVYMHDYGPREGANGTVAYADDGTPASYLVAAGDYDDAVLERLCVGYYSLDAVNAVRRGEGTLSQLYAGDTLNLSPYTITSVGDINGAVNDFETSFVLPPQQ